MGRALCPSVQEERAGSFCTLPAPATTPIPRREEVNGNSYGSGRLPGKSSTVAPIKHMGQGLCVSLLLTRGEIGGGSLGLSR